MKLKHLLLLICILICNIQAAVAQCPVSSTPTSNSYYGYVSISNVTLASVSTPHPGAPTSGYNLFTTPVRNMTIGSVYPFSVSLGNYSCGVAIWIDLNNNGQYDNAEMLTSNAPSYGPVTGNITIPGTATAATVRMRVRACYYFTLTAGMACTNNPGYGYGETEDYVVTLVSPCAGPVITAQPSDTKTCPGGIANFTTTATSAATYKWQVDPGSGFTDLSDNSTYSGTSTASLTISNASVSLNNYKYRCRATSGCGTPTNTSFATLTFHQPVSVTGQTTNVVSCIGSYKTMNITTGPAQITNYRWQVGTLTNGYVDVPAAYPYSGTLTPQLDITYVQDTMDGLSYRCIIEGPCSADTSADIPMEVLIGPRIATPPVNDTIPPYGNAQFDVITSGNEFLLFWQASADGGATFVNINTNSLYTNTTTPQLYINQCPPSLTGYQYRCILKSTNATCGVYYDTSDAATLFVGPFGGVAVNDKGTVDNNLSIYPNPATGSEVFLAMKTPIQEDLKLSVTDKLGKTVYKGNTNLSKGNAPLPVGQLAPGVYTISLADKNDNPVNSVQFTKQ